MPGSGTAGLDLLLPILRCPICGEPLSRADGALGCAERHSFDISRHGYASLLTGTAPTSGDDAPMVRARERFLAGGAYAPIRTAIADLATRTAPAPQVVLDSGCGTGYYLAGVLDSLPGSSGLGMDSSARALQAAAKAHPLAAAVRSDVFGPFPIASSSVDLVLDVFAPRNPAEFHRVLRADGRLIVVRPTHGHLRQLLESVKGTVGIDPIKEERLHQALDPYLEAVETRTIEYTAALTGEQAADLISMTPSARHLAAADVAGPATATLPEEVDVSVLLTVYRARY